MADRELAVETRDLTRVFRVRRREARGQAREIVALDRVTPSVERGGLALASTLLFRLAEGIAHRRWLVNLQTMH